MFFPNVLLLSYQPPKLNLYKVCVPSLSITHSPWWPDTVNFVLLPRDSDSSLTELIFLWWCLTAALIAPPLWNFPTHRFTSPPTPSTGGSTFKYLSYFSHLLNWVYLLTSHPFQSSFLWDRGSLYSTGHCGIYYVAQAGLTLLVIFLGLLSTQSIHVRHHVQHKCRIIKLICEDFSFLVWKMKRLDPRVLNSSNSS